MDCIFLMMFTTLSYFDNSIVTKKYVRGDLNSGCHCRKRQIKLSLFMAFSYRCQQW